MNELYFKKQDGNYYVFLLGKNGEPKPGVNIRVTVRHLKYPASPQEIIKTDAEGKVKLGHLKNVREVEAHAPLFGIQRKWQVLPRWQKIAYPHSIECLEGET